MREAAVVAVVLFASGAVEAVVVPAGLLVPNMLGVVPAAVVAADEVAVDTGAVVVVAVVGVAVGLAPNKLLVAGVDVDEVAAAGVVVAGFAKRLEDVADEAGAAVVGVDPNKLVVAADEVAGAAEIGVDPNNVFAAGAVDVADIVEVVAGVAAAAVVLVPNSGFDDAAAAGGANSAVLGAVLVAGAVIGVPAPTATEADWPPNSVDGVPVLA